MCISTSCLVAVKVLLMEINYSCFREASLSKAFLILSGELTIISTLMASAYWKGFFLFYILILFALYFEVTIISGEFIVVDRNDYSTQNSSLV